VVEFDRGMKIDLLRGRDPKSATGVEKIGAALQRRQRSLPPARAEWRVLACTWRGEM
jgi:hypothetical protein